MTDPTFAVTVLVVLAFVFRFGALICLILVWHYFWRIADDPMVTAFRWLWGTFTFLLAWVCVASVAELVGYITGSSTFVEHSAAYIFIPNAVVFLALVRLLVKLHGLDRKS